MPSTWQSIAAETCRPVYGFHGVEEGFVWSSHAFGLFFPKAGQTRGAVLLEVYSPHGDLALECRIGERSFVVTVPHGDQRILLDADCVGQFVDFTISPKILIGSDVRELGLLVRRIAWEARPGASCHRFLPTRLPSRTTVSSVPDGLDRLRDAARTIGAQAVGGFLREGWFKADSVGDSLGMQLHAPLWMPLAAEIDCQCTIDGREETVAFRRDQDRPNLYRATLPLQRITGRADGLLDIEEPI
ncbi:MAG: hypothetical protein WCJ18_09550, partial [Planctomycetota bacterium]